MSSASKVRTLELRPREMRGRDVAELQRLLGLEETGTYDYSTAVTVYRAQLSLGLKHPTHDAPPALIDQLGRIAKVAPIGDVGLRLMRGASSRTPLELTELDHDPVAAIATATRHLEAAAISDRERHVRLAIVAAWHLILANASRVHYPPGDVRRNSVYSIATVAQLLAVIRGAGGLYADCSQTVDITTHVGGGKNPNTGTAVWRSDGYTGSEISGCVTITRAQALPADLHVYGPGTGHHVAQVIVAGPDPLMGSHGHNPPVAVRDSVEASFQPAGGRWLRIPI